MSTPENTRLPAGIRKRHTRSCAASRECSCAPSFEAGIYSKRDRRKVRRSFSSLAEAKRWLNEQRKKRDDGALAAPSRISLNEAASRWLELAGSGGALNRSGDRFKPSVIRSYRASLTLHVLPHLGHERMADITRGQLQRLVADWQTNGMQASTVGNAVNSVRALYSVSDLLTSGALPTNPCVGLRLPSRRGRRDRIASVQEAIRLVEVLPPAERATWGLAFWAGLRHGEIRALTWGDVGLAAGTLAVRASWDQHEGPVEPKSRAGARQVPIIGRLRDLLTEHRAITGRVSGLVCGRTEMHPFASSTVNDRASRAWKAAQLDPIGLHEARHTFASFLIASGLNVKTVSVYMGHASAAFTLDRYGHLLPGNEAEAIERVDAFLERSNTSARLDALVRTGAVS